MVEAMLLGEVFERFVAESPFSVMIRMLLEQCLSAEAVDELFDEKTQRQYQRELLFSSVVNLMSLVVCGIVPSLNAAYQAKSKGIGVSIQSVYNKLNGLEPQIGEALLRQVVNRAETLVETLQGALPPLLEGYRVKILDGNHLAASERRLQVLRPVGSAPLPGHALVILDPRNVPS
jgi:hypothetical protein